MAAQRMNGWSTVGTIAYLGLLVVGIPAAAYHLSQGRYPQALMATGAVLAGLALVAIEMRQRRAAVARLPLEELVMAPAVPVTIRAVSTSGNCPRGFRPGNTWAIDRAGHLAPPLCQPALAVVSPLLRAASGMDEGQATCRCPLGDYRVTFAVTGT